MNYDELIRLINSSKNYTFRLENQNSEIVKWVLTDLYSETRALREQVRDLNPNIGSLLSQSLIPALRSFKEVIDGFPPRIRNVFIQLAEQGWYFDDEMYTTIIPELECAFENEEIQEIESEMANYYSENADRIKQYLINKFPHRSKIISSAFKAHYEEQYEFSIPIFLMQADGICADLFDKSLFTKNNNKPEMAYVLKDIDDIDDFERATLIVLESITAINASKKDRSAESTALNRHQIIHGESLDYGTKTNSLKAISFINHVVQSLEKIFIAVSNK